MILLFVVWPLYEQTFPISTESCSRAACLPAIALVTDFLVQCFQNNSLLQVQNEFVRCLWTRRSMLWISIPGTEILTCQPGFLPMLKRALWEYDLYRFLLPYKGQWGAWPSESFLPYQRTTFETRAGLLKTGVVFLVWCFFVLFFFNALPPPNPIEKHCLFCQHLYAKSSFLFSDILPGSRVHQVGVWQHCYPLIQRMLSSRQLSLKKL